MAATRDIKRRIKSIGNTKKVTGAMQMVSAAKMRRAMEAVLRARTYANLSWATILNLSRVSAQSNEASHPLFSSPQEIKKVGIILITSNRGLCGGFNAALLKKVRESIIRHPSVDGQPLETEFILLGKKGAAIYKYFGYNIVADFFKEDLATSFKDALPVAKMATGDFLSGKYDKIFVAYTDFVSSIKQIPRVRQLLPIDEKTQADFLDLFEIKDRDNFGKGSVTEYFFEPSPQEVLNEMVPRLVETQIFQAMLESNASEHSARMAAMRQATDAAGELVDELTLFYNKARQAGITAEIAEISAGANALKK